VGLSPHGAATASAMVSTVSRNVRDATISFPQWLLAGLLLQNVSSMTSPARLGHTQCSANLSSLPKHHFSSTTSTARAIASVAVPASYLNTPILTPLCLKLTRVRQNAETVVSRRFGNRLVTWVSSVLSYTQRFISLCGTVRSC